jgi:gamma-glutamylcyclotransferase (GGCT)/AIG2-like uncharacterized protein YtfP
VRTVRVFVYGTLRPGASAWDLVAASVKAVEPATAAGTLHDTGRGYPAARFGATGTITGALMWVERDLLPSLDGYEGVATGLFRRVEITAQTAQGPVPAWGYEYLATTEDLPVIDGGDYLG